MTTQPDVEIAVQQLAETEKAYLFFDGKQQVWIAKSQIRDQTETKEGKIESIFISEWLANEKGLI